MPSVFLKTYGCQMNERDTEQVARDLLQRGYERAETEQEADVILLNTCSVRDLAEQKALRKMSNLKVLRKKNPGLVLGFLGCMAQRKGGSLEKEMKGLDLGSGKTGHTCKQRHGKTDEAYEQYDQPQPP